MTKTPPTLTFYRIMTFGPPNLCRLGVRPCPLPDEFRIDTVVECLLLGRDLHVVELLADTGALVLQHGQAVNGIHGETVTIGLVADSQLKRGIDVTLLLVSSDVDVELTRALVGESVDEPWVGMEIEDDGLVVGEDVGPLLIGHSMGMVSLVDELEEIDNVDESDLELGEELAEKSGGSKRLLRGDITAGSHDEIRLLTVVVGSKVPDSDTLGAVSNSLIHGKELKMVLLVCNNDVDVVGGTEAMVHDGEKGVSVRWEVDSDNIGALVGDNIEETGILMGETIVILSPDGGGKKDVEGGDLRTPLDLVTFLDPFAMLVDHGVDDVDEGLV